MITNRFFFFLLALTLMGCDKPQVNAAQDQSATNSATRIQTTWFVNPTSGSDDHSGASLTTAWKSMTKVNSLKLEPGHKVVIAPGLHNTSLQPTAHGTAEKPVIIEFSPGTHRFPKETAIRRAYHISNSCAAPEEPMPIGILIKNCKHLTLQGGGAEKTTLMMQGRMVHFINDHSHNIRYQHLTFDLKRPTVSEFLVLNSDETTSTIHIAEGSTYEIKDNEFRWTGDIGRPDAQMMTQRAIPAEGRSQRVSTKWTPFDDASKIDDLGQNRVRLHFEKKNPLLPGHQYQFRTLFRDVVGAHNNRCSNITISDCDIHALAGMGIISQFTDGITYERVKVVPPPQTIRTCPAWADVFHFSGCKGQITVKDCQFSGTQDDPINVHGTHLRIINQPSPHQLMVRFEHKQTYGFAAFQPGDEIAVIQAKTLLEHPENPRRKVNKVERLSDRNWLLTLDGPAPAFHENDVVDNISWYPDVTIQNCYVDMCSTRGFLLTTRGKVLIEGNTLKRCRMPGILIENDANGWFESGPIRDMTIRNNTFIGHGIHINPRVQEGDAPVHKNIRIIDNTFMEGAGINAHHVSDLVIQNNRSDEGDLKVTLDPESTSVTIPNSP